MFKYSMVEEQEVNTEETNMAEEIIEEGNTEVENNVEEVAPVENKEKNRFVQKIEKNEKVLRFKNLGSNTESENHAIKEPENKEEVEIEKPKAKKTKEELKAEKRAAQEKLKEEKAALKAEKKEKKLQKKKEKAEKKAERKREKEHRKEIERLNRMLKPVSKKTLESLNIISFDPEVATIRMTENNWLKTYKLEGMNEENRNQFIDGLVETLSLRARITSNFKLAESNRLVRTDYITFFLSAEIYETVKLALDAEVEKINAICEEVNLVEISINNYMNQVTRNFQHDGEELNFEKLKKRKHDWRNIAFNKLTLNDDCFTVGDKVGTCMQVIQFPGEVGRNFLQELLEINMPMMFITDIQPYTNEENEDYKRLLAKKYNIDIKQFENSFMNVGLTIVIMTDTTEKKDALIDAIEEFFTEEHMVIAPVYGNTADVLESSFSYGIKDYHSMRNMQNGQVKQLVV